MTDHSARFAMPLLQPGQAQKEMFHNEALVRADAVLHPVVATIATDMPPASPVAGMCWIVGPAAGGAWAGQAGRLAAWTEGGWRFVSPVAGMTAWLQDAARWAWHDGTAWRGDATPTNGVAVAGKRVIGARQASIAAPAGGGTVDAEARSALVSVLSALRMHGLIES